VRKQFVDTIKREGQTIFLQWVRAIIALSVIGTAIYVEITGGEMSEALVMLLGFVASLYFEKGKMIMATREEEEPEGE
jgi:hypothetical protein